MKDELGEPSSTDQVEPGTPAERKKRRKWPWIVGIVLAMVIIGAAASDDEKKDPAQPAAITQTPTSAAEPADTGRMSQGEFDRLQISWEGFADENTQLSDGFRKCAVLLSNLELAAASECVGDAYSGFDANAAGLYVTLEGLQEDVAKGCLRRVKQLLPLVDDYASNVKILGESGENLQFELFTATAKTVSNQIPKVIAAKDRLDLACTPDK